MSRQCVECGKKEDAGDNHYTISPTTHARSTVAWCVGCYEKLACRAARNKACGHTKAVGHRCKESVGGRGDFAASSRPWVAAHLSDVQYDGAGIAGEGGVVDLLDDITTRICEAEGGAA